MFCPKCGSKVETNMSECANCNYNFEKEIANSEQKNESRNDVTANLLSNFIRPKILIFAIIAIAVLVMFFMGANYISEGGSKIMSIQSVAGNSIEEAYYNNLGSIYAGYALIARALGIFFSSLLVWLGLRN